MGFPYAHKLHHRNRPAWTLTPDAQLLADAVAAEQRHDANCKCKTRVRLSGPDGPSIAMFEAAWRLAESLDDVYGPDSDDAVAATMIVMLDRYRKARQP